MFQSPIFKKYLLPGFMFQSVVIVGGYGTGRELMEYFLNLGPKSGFLAMMVTMITWGVVCSATFEFARKFKGYDYRHFFKALLGPRFWYVFELCYLTMVVVVLGIIAASTGSILNIILDIPFNYGVLGLMAIIFYLVLKGSRLIEILFSYWSIFLYIIYISFFLMCFLSFGDNIQHNFMHSENKPHWFYNGIVYASYNLGFIPAVFFCLRHIETRKEAICSGLLAGAFAMIPGILFLIAATSYYPQIVDIEIPSTFLLQQLGHKPLLILFHVILLGSLIETGTSMIHAINERLYQHWMDRHKKPPKFYRGFSALFFITIAIFVAQLGLSTLIAKGYGTLTWGFLAIYIIPLFTIGLMKLRSSKPT